MSVQGHQATPKRSKTHIEEKSQLMCTQRNNLEPWIELLQIRDNWYPNPENKNKGQDFNGNYLEGWGLEGDR